MAILQIASFDGGAVSLDLEVDTNLRVTGIVCKNDGRGAVRVDVTTEGAKMYSQRFAPGSGRLDVPTTGAARDRLQLADVTLSASRGTRIGGLTVGCAYPVP